MKTDLEIRYAGMKALRDSLGLVESERFITLILREPFDYTKWRQNLWKDKSVDELFLEASQWCKTNLKS